MQNESFSYNIILHPDIFHANSYQLDIKLIQSSHKYLLSSQNSMVVKNFISIF